MRLLPAALVGLLSTLSTTVHAHAGHGAVHEWHWHATDTAGFLTVAVLAAITLWLSRGD
jgi:hypothetical protein